jgi:rubrerythrin
MKVFDRAIQMEEQTEMDYQKLAAAAANSEANDLFSILAEAELVHHDALVEIDLDIGLKKPQFKLFPGRACLFRTSPGKA